MKCTLLVVRAKKVNGNIEFRPSIRHDVLTCPIGRASGLRLRCTAFVTVLPNSAQDAVRHAAAAWDDEVAALDDWQSRSCLACRLCRARLDNCVDSNPVFRAAPRGVHDMAARAARLGVSCWLGSICTSILRLPRALLRR